MACNIQELIKWAKGVYSPLRTSGLAHRLYLQNAAVAIPINFEVIELSEFNTHAPNGTNANGYALACKRKEKDE